MADADKDADISINEGGSSEVAAIHELLAECGIEEYDPRVVGMLMDAQFALTTKILETASGLVKHNTKNTIDAEDVQAAADILGLMQHMAPNREKMLQLALDKNAQPLPQIRHNYGLKLPNDRFCQLQQNVEFKTNDFEPVEPRNIQNPVPMVEKSMTMLRPEQVQNILKRKATDDDFDS